MRTRYPLIFLLNILLMNFESANAQNLDVGKKVFFENCSVCHKGGNNIILPEKNLRKETLRTNGMNSETAIMYQVTNGKNGMPAFGGRLSENEIHSVAIYVLDQADKDFKSE